MASSVAISVVLSFDGPRAKIISIFPEYSCLRIAEMQLLKSRSSLRIGKITETEGSDKSFITPPVNI